MGLGLLGENGEDGAVHLQQDSYHQIHPNSHPNNSPIEELFLYVKFFLFYFGSIGLVTECLMSPSLVY